jgi:hypothetical protein
VNSFISQSIIGRYPDNNIMKSNSNQLILQYLEMSAESEEEPEAAVGVNGPILDRSA